MRNCENEQRINCEINSANLRCENMCKMRIMAWSFLTFWCIKCENANNGAIFVTFCRRLVCLALGCRMIGFCHRTFVYIACEVMEPQIALLKLDPVDPLVFPSTTETCELLIRRTHAVTVCCCYNVVSSRILLFVVSLHSSHCCREWCSGIRLNVIHQDNDDVVNMLAFSSGCLVTAFWLILSRLYKVDWSPVVFLMQANSHSCSLHMMALSELDRSSLVSRTHNRWFVRASDSLLNLLWHDEAKHVLSFHWS